MYLKNVVKYKVTKNDNTLFKDLRYYFAFIHKNKLFGYL